MAKKKVFMRTTIGALVLLVSAIVILSMTPKAPGQYQLVGDFITLDPNASGTKLYATLTIHYVPDVSEDPNYIPICSTGFKAAEFFMRIRKGNDLYGFGGNFQDYGLICWENTNGENGQEWAVDQFLKKVVFPAIFNTLADNPPPYAIKSYGEIIKQGHILSPDGYDESSESGTYAILDIVIAVQE